MPIQGHARRIGIIVNSALVRSFRRGIGRLGPFTAAILCALAVPAALSTVAPFGSLNALSVAAGSAALVAMSLCLILATRLSVLEPLFGGLDRMYRAHKWLGLSALALMVAHDILEPRFKRWVHETWLGEAAGSLGEIAFYGLIGLIALSWIKRIPGVDWEIPYPIWWFTHRFTGTLFAIAAAHQLLVDVPYSRTGALDLYVNGFCLAGLAAYLFVELVDKRWRRRAYDVVSVRPGSGATAVELKPADRAMQWRPGQFAFLRAREAGLDEPHPFTIANSPQTDGLLRFEIKPLGGWTREVPLRLAPGSRVEVEGPYGRFDFRDGGERQVWIAGGVGITPFLAWLQAPGIAEGRRIHLLYSVRRADDAVGLDTLEMAAAQYPGFSYDLLVSGIEGRPTAERLVARAPFVMDGTDFFFCGPESLRRSLLAGLKERGLAPGHVHFELFEFR